MLTQSQIDAIAEAVVQSMKPAPAPDIKNSTGAAAGNHPMPRTADMKKDRPVEASEVVPLGASFMMEKSPSEAGKGRGESHGDEKLEDITSPEVKAIPLLDHIEDTDDVPDTG